MSAAFLKGLLGARLLFPATLAGEDWLAAKRRGESNDQP